MISFPQDGPGLLAQRPPGGVVHLVEHRIKRPLSHQLPPTDFAGQQCSQKLRRQGGRPVRYAAVRRLRPAGSRPPAKGGPELKARPRPARCRIPAAALVPAMPGPCRASVSRRRLPEKQRRPAVSSGAAGPAAGRSACRSHPVCPGRHTPPQPRGRCIRLLYGPCCGPAVGCGSWSRPAPASPCGRSGPTADRAASFFRRRPPARRHGPFQPEMGTVLRTAFSGFPPRP